MNLFVEPTITPDTETTRTCSTCFEPLPFEDFYSDGTDKDGNKKYRRDCKNCYRITRLKARRSKKQERLDSITPKPTRRKRK